MESVKCESRLSLLLPGFHRQDWFSIVKPPGKTGDLREGVRGYREQLVNFLEGSHMIQCPWLE